MTKQSRKSQSPEAVVVEKSATVSDVARLANVSTAAVSMYFSDRSEHLKRVGPEARERIRRAVEELGYVPNKIARHFRRQKSERLCVIFPKLGIPYADRMVHGLGKAARERGFMPIIVTASNLEDLETILGEVEAGLADGVVAEVDYLTEAEVEKAFSSMTKHCLVIHATAKPGPFSVLNNGLTAALEVAFEDLVLKGHRHIGYIENTSQGTNPRLNAVVRRREELGIDTKVSVLTGASERSTAADCARQIASWDERPTAVIVESDFTAVTVIEEFSRLGIAVPDQIAVVGCGNAEEGFYCRPRLTTIGPEWSSFEEAGQYLIDGLGLSKPLPPRRFNSPWSYIRRNSA
ncbi:LacI family DNA-binding transcriptional regulator [Rhizobium sp. 16-449-1b]|nr:LacI family DNA-binding transcriptional regulator [Rhizobium sp. 16-449-1b]MBO9195328.1 LacI family DNA-binding transcriptional regulator [Rhizobium sp. 16-449-1b]